MHLPSFEYLRPASVDQALGWLAAPGRRAAVLAGGTDLLASMGQRLIVPDAVVSIRDLGELRGIARREDGGLRIGAGTSLTALEEDAELARAFPMLHEAIGAVASVHVRNMATLGGNLALPTRCWYTNQTQSWRNARAGCFKTDSEQCHVLASAHQCVATSSADSVPALLALDATVTLASVRGIREVPLAGFYRADGARPTVLQPDELITYIDVPSFAGRAAFVKVTPREGIDFGLGTIAVAVTGTNRRPRVVRIVVNSLGSQPMRLRAAEQILMEQGLSVASIEAAAAAGRPDLGEITSLWTPAGYKRRLVRAMLSRALEQVRRARPVAGGARA
jgi:xanthine dehydrogenase YagS FAD-binding subunit